MNFAALINDIRTHLLTQGTRAWDPHEQACRYRMNDGKSCAVGCLIPDSMYTPRIEYNDITNLIEMSQTDDPDDVSQFWPMFKSHLESKYGKLKDGREAETLLNVLQNAQTIHDNVNSELSWTQRLDELAAAYA